MSISASFDEDAAAVEPGGEAVLSVHVANSGTTVEELSLEPVGPCAQWCVVEPARLSLYPGASGSAEVRVRPPRVPATAAGETTLGLRVVPTSDANLPVVAERPLTVLPFTDLAAELVPLSSHSAWRGRHRAAVDNRGNTPVVVALTAQGADDRTRFSLEPAELTVPGGETKLARLNARPAKRLWRGAPATHAFRIMLAPRSDDEGLEAQPTVLDGTFEQQPILPRWLPRAVAAAVVLVGLLVGLWYGLLRPTVRSAARDAITPDTIRSAAAVAPAGSASAGNTAGASAGDTAGSGGAHGPSSGTVATSAPAGGTGGGSSGGAGGGSGGGAGAAAVPASKNLHVTDAVGNGAKTKTAYAVGSGKSFGLTDIVVQNPQGDAGTLVVATQDGQILSLALEDFRASDYHFVTPIEVPAGGRITLSVDCREVGHPVKAPVPSQCSESLFLGGTLQTGDRRSGT